MKAIIVFGRFVHPALLKAGVGGGSAQIETNVHSYVHVDDLSYILSADQLQQLYEAVPPLTCRLQLWAGFERLRSDEAPH